MRGASPLHHRISMDASLSEASCALARMTRVVLDFRDRSAQCGEPRLLLRNPKMSLHGGKLALGPADVITGRTA